MKYEVNKSCQAQIEAMIDLMNRHVTHLTPDDREWLKMHLDNLVASCLAVSPLPPPKKKGRPGRKPGVKS